jgi:hypothetical protein
MHCKGRAYESSNLARSNTSVAAHNLWSILAYSGIQAAGDRQVQCVPCPQGGGRFDEHRCGTKIRRFNFCRNKVHGCKSLKIGNGLLACLGVYGT